MSDRTAENEVTTVHDQLGEEEKSRGEGEGEEREKAREEEDVVASLAPKPKQIQEDSEGRAECQIPAFKNKPGRVQSVFSLVRDQIRGQPGREASRTGMLQLVQHVTRQLDRTKVEQDTSEDTSPRKEVRETLEVQEEEIAVDMGNEKTNEESNKDECVILLQQILDSIEGLRKEVGEELHLLRQESRSNTDKVLREVEIRLTRSLNTNTDANTPASVPPLPGGPRKRILRRTLTTMVPKNSTAQAFRPRCMSEPVGGQNTETTSTGNGILPLSSLEPLLPSIVVTRQTKKPVRSKQRMNKPVS